MSPQRMWYTLLWCACLLLGIPACDAESRPLAAAPARDPVDVFDAQQLPATPNDNVIIDKDTAGEVVVVAYLPGNSNNPAQDEVALDYIITGDGSNTDQALAAAIAARQHMTVTMNRIDTHTIKIDVHDEVPTDKVMLHVRVPQHVDLDIRSGAGDISVFGAVDQVEVHANDGGNISVHGALGNLTLATLRGFIRVDQRAASSPEINATATHGAITIFALAAYVTAKAPNGSILFVGTLGPPLQPASSFEASGNIVIALPDSLPSYTMSASGKQRIIYDTLSKTKTCIVRSAGSNYSYQTQTASDRFGRVEISRMNSTPDLQITSMMDSDSGYLAYDVNGAAIKLVSALNAMPPMLEACKSEIEKKLSKAPVLFSAHSDGGEIMVRYIHMHSP